MDQKKYVIDEMEIYGYEKPRKLIVNHIEDKEEPKDVDFLTAFMGFLLIVGFLAYVVIILKYPTLAANQF